MNSFHETVGELPYLTCNLPGTGGVIKQFDEDFFVEEVPQYLPTGRGTHVYFTIEKRGLATLAAIDLIARALGRKPREIGYAGLKDAHGVTRQTLSVEHVDPAQVESLSLAQIKILSVGLHTNKLKLGHLAGNRFCIKIRKAAPSGLEDARRIVGVLATRGVPNYFGPQRFGVRGDNADIGMAVLHDDLELAVTLMLGSPTAADHGPMRRARELFDAGDFHAAADAWPRKFAQQARVCRTLVTTDGDFSKAWRAVDHTLRKLYVSAVQSKLFNRILAERIAALDRIETGDVAWKHRNGACFLVEDADVEQPRCDEFEISPTGPLFGKKMKPAKGRPGERETAVLETFELSRGEVRTRDGTKLDGARRPLRVPLKQPEVDAGEDERGAFLRLSFALPPGAYATNVTREVSKGAES